MKHRQVSHRVLPVRFPGGLLEAWPSLPHGLPWLQESVGLGNPVLLMLSKLWFQLKHQEKVLRNLDHTVGLQAAGLHVPPASGSL